MSSKFLTARYILTHNTVLSSPPFRMELLSLLLLLLLLPLLLLLLLLLVCLRGDADLSTLAWERWGVTLKDGLKGKVRQAILNNCLL